MNPLYIYILVIVLVLLLAIAIGSGKRNQLRRYTQISIGMSEEEMLRTMGSGYNVSSLKGNRRKYEWRINSSSMSFGRVRTYSGVSKVTITTDNGRVAEIRPYNVK